MATGVDDLTVFYFRESSCSQRVLVTLIEKDIKFKGVELNIWTGECYEPWYAKINPRMEVPALKHGNKIITDSSRIIDYLEETFPAHPIKEPKAECERMVNIIGGRENGEVPFMGLITYGAYANPKYRENSQMSSLVMRFQEAKAKQISTGNIQPMLKMFSNYADQNPDLREVYLNKISIMKGRGKGVVSNISTERFPEVLVVVGEILEKIELELSRIGYVESGEEQWLCGSTFNLADIYLVTLLSRLNTVGLIKGLLEKRSLLRLYFSEFQKRKSAAVFQRPLLWVMFKSLAKIAIKQYGTSVALFGLVLAGAGYVARQHFIGS